MPSEALVIAALGVLGAILSIVGLRLATQLRRMRARLVAELSTRERLTEKLADLDAARVRATEARDAADGLRRELSNARSEITALEEEIEALKRDVLRGTAAESAAMAKRSEIESKLTALIRAAEGAQAALHENAGLMDRARSEAAARDEQVARLERQLLETEKKLA